MKLVSIPFLVSFGLMSALTANACSDFDLVAQAVDNEGYNPNTLSPVALQIELYLEDGPAERACARNQVELVSQTARSVRDVYNGRATIKGKTPADQSVFASVSGSRIQLSQAAVHQLVSTGRIVIEYAWIDAGSFYPAGAYSSALDVVVNGVPVAAVEPEISVYPAMRLLGDVSKGYGNIDFGTLESFEEASASFLYQTNTKLRVTATSQNDGQLVHEAGAATYAITYTAQVNDSIIDTSGAQTITLDGAVGARSIGNVRLKLGDIGSPVAGAYEDVLTLSFTAD